jgi:hypothetical protein
VIIPGDPVIRVVDLHTGRTTTTLKTVSDALVILFDPSGRYFVLLRQSTVLELWRRDPLRREIGPLRSLSGIAGTPIVARFVNSDGRFVVAANNAIRVYQIGQKAPVESYDFGLPDGSHELHPYAFLDIANGGRTVLYGIDNQTANRPLTLDPSTWERQLCAVIGYRNFTADERDSLPANIPSQQVCSATG